MFISSRVAGGGHSNKGGGECSPFLSIYVYVSIENDIGKFCRFPRTFSVYRKNTKLTVVAGFDDKNSWETYNIFFD